MSVTCDMAPVVVVEYRVRRYSTDDAVTTEAVVRDAMYMYGSFRYISALTDWYIGAATPHHASAIV